MSCVRFCASRATSIATGLISGSASGAKRFAHTTSRADAAYAHANLAIDTKNHVAAKQAGD